MCCPSVIPQPMSCPTPCCDPACFHRYVGIMFFSLYHKFTQADCVNALPALKKATPTLSTKPEYCYMTPDNKTCVRACGGLGGLGV